MIFDNENLNNESFEQESTQETKPEDTGAQDSNYWKEQFLRVSADFSNSTRRMEKERMGWTRSAQIPIIETFLPLIDELDLAIKASEQVSSQEALKFIEGFKIIQKNVQKKLADLGVKQIEVSKIFDPNFHEAIMIEPASETYATGEVVKVLSPGYTFGDTVIRHAKVSVAE